jgi:transaldolase
LNKIREAAALGLIDGVTTNPSLVGKEGGSIDFSLIGARRHDESRD